MAPVETEYYDLVRQTTPPPNTRGFLTCSFTGIQLGVSVDCEETDLKKAYRKAAMKVPDLASQVPQFESSDMALASATVVGSSRYV